MQYRPSSPVEDTEWSLVWPEQVTDSQAGSEPLPSTPGFSVPSILCQVQTLTVVLFVILLL